jgi:hypothetical protein
MRRTWCLCERGRKSVSAPTVRWTLGGLTLGAGLVLAMARLTAARFAPTLQSIALDDGAFRGTYCDPTAAAHPTGLQTGKSAGIFNGSANQTTQQSIANDDGTAQVHCWDTTNAQPWKEGVHY